MATDAHNAKVDRLLRMIREGKTMTLRQQLSLVVQLSIPAIVAQFSSIAMQYIDAAMVGSVGADASASIGLVSTSTWLMMGLCSAVAIGFTVQVAHLIGANDFRRARSVLRQSFVAAAVFGLFMALSGSGISGELPEMLGGTEEINPGATHYFMIFSLFLPVLLMIQLSGGMLRCSGNMKIPSMLNVLMCVLDVVFNYFLIFPTREINVLGLPVNMPGAGLGVVGAALGTGFAEVVVAVVMIWFLCRKSPELKLAGEKGSFAPRREVLWEALRISTPLALEHAVICGAQIVTTVIVAPLGVFAIAANSFAITAESLCYMPGYGISDAATTLVGQSVGARRKHLCMRFANITVVMGIAVMGVMGVIMYVFAPEIIGVMTPVGEIRELGVMALRIEAFAEPMFAASIVAYGAFVGAGYTLVPSLMNLVSIWAVRLSLAAYLAPLMGLRGVWIAMCVELCFRGVIFLVRLWTKGWTKKIDL